MKTAKENHQGVVFFTGAGASVAAGLPTYRGLGSTGYAGATNDDVERANPTETHFAMAELVRRGFADGVVTTNIDGLHFKSGLNVDALVELHGSLFNERCPKCNDLYKRDRIVCVATPADLTIDTKGRNEPAPTGNVCTRPGCDGRLFCTAVARGADIAPEDYARARDMFVNASLAIVIGSSMQVEPAATLPFLADGVAVVNPTPTGRERNRKCKLAIRSASEPVMKQLRALLLD